MFHSILNKINNGVAFEASKTTEAKVTWKKKRDNSHSIVLNSDNYVIPNRTHIQNLNYPKVKEICPQRQPHLQVVFCDRTYTIFYAIRKNSIEKEEIATRSRMFHSILNKINNGVAFEASKTTEAKVTWKKEKRK